MHNAERDGDRQKRRMEQPVRVLPRNAPDKQSVKLIVTSYMVQRTNFIEILMDPELSIPPCHKTDNSAFWMLENLFDLPGTAEKLSFLEDGYPESQETSLPHCADESVHGGRRGWAIVWCNVEDVSIRREHGRDGSGIYADPPGPTRILLSVALSGASGTSATCTEFRRKPYLTSCRNASGTEPSEQKSEMLQGTRFRNCCQHATPKRQAPAHPVRIKEIGESGTL